MNGWRVLSATIKLPDGNSDDSLRVAEVTIVDEHARHVVLEVSHAYLKLAQELHELDPDALNDLDLPAAAIRSAREM